MLLSKDKLEDDLHVEPLFWRKKESDAPTTYFSSALTEVSDDCTAQDPNYV